MPPHQSKNKKKNPLRQLLENLSKTTKSSTTSYALLLEGSRHFQLRYLQQQTASANNNDDDEHKVYQRATLLTPQQAACLDWQAGSCTTLWLNTIMDTLLGILPPADDDRRIFWIQTIASGNRSRWRHRDDNRVTVIDLSVNPWGWDTDNDNNDDKVLEQAIVAIDEEQQQQASSFVIIESITPLIMRYGMLRTCQFLNRIRGGHGHGRQYLSDDPVVHHHRHHLNFPIQTEMWTVPQLRQFENSAAINAILSLQATSTTNQRQQGQKAATVQMLRQGIREPSNLIRENVYFQIVDNDDDGGCGIRLVLQSPPLEEEESDDNTTAATDPQQQRHRHVNNNAAIIPEETELPSSDTTTTGRQRQRQQQNTKGVPTLQVDEGARKIATTTQESVLVPEQQQPRIYLQDDDLEFDDYDEEDPDDDLDI